MPYQSIYSGRTNTLPSGKTNPFASNYKPGQYLAKPQSTTETAPTPQPQSQAPVAPKGATAPKQGTGLLHTIGAYADSLIHAPGGAIHDIRTGQPITDYRNGAIIVKRAPLAKTEAIIKQQGGSVQNGQKMQLDHIIPLEAGGTNDKNNLKLIPKAQDQANNSVEDYLGNQLKANVINGQQAKKLVTDYKSGKITAQQVYDQASELSALDAAVKRNTGGSLLHNIKVAGGKAVLHSVATAGREIAQGTARSVEELVPSALQVAGVKPAPGGNKLNKGGQFLFGKAPLQTIQQEATGAQSSHPGGFHIKGTPITLTPKETGIAEGVGKTAFDVAQLVGGAKGTKAKIDKFNATTATAKNTVKNVATNNLLNKIKYSADEQLPKTEPVKPSPVQNTNEVPKTGSDLSYKDTSTGQGREPAKVMASSEPKTPTQQGSGNVKPPSGIAEHQALTEHAMKFKTAKGFMDNAKTQKLVANSALPETLTPANLQEIHAQALEPRNVPLEPLADTTPKIKTSKLASGVEQKAIEKKLTAGFEGKPEYAQVNIPDQAKAAANLLKTDQQRAIRIAHGQELPPEGLLPESVFVATENHALKTGNVDLLKSLATESSLPSEATGMGQRIRILRERDPNSPVSAINQVLKARTKAAEGRLGKPINQAVNDTTKAIKSATPKVTRQDWSSFVESLRC